MKHTLTIPTAMSADRNTNISATIKDISKRLFGFIKQRVRSTEDAEDILQDVFHQFAGSTTPIEQASSWLYKVAKNKITDNYRKHKLPLADDLFAGIEKDESLLDWKEMLMPSDSNPETIYLRNLFWDALQQALDELPLEQSSVFVQNEIDGIPFKEIERQTGVSVATLISRKRYAVLHLRDRLGGLKNEILNY